MSRAPTIFIAAGEASGDLHGARLARALKDRMPGVRLMGLGGDRMAAEGVEILEHVNRLAIMGIAEIVKHLPFLVQLRKRVFATLAEDRPDLVIPIDYPGFNLRLAARARRERIPVLFYIAPQVWAWHKSRTKLLARDTDALAVILPFEEAFFRQHGVNAHFVGHPLLDTLPDGESRAEWAARVGIDPNRPILAVYPGSRGQEVRSHMKTFSAAVERVRAVRPDVQPVIGAARSLDPTLFADSPWMVTDGSDGLLRYADAALVKSGTTTLEATLAGTPFVVAYRVKPLTYKIAKRLVDVKYIALPNLVADREVVPELIQDAMTPDALSAALIPLLNPASEVRRTMVNDLAAVRARLGEAGAAGRVADLAASMIEKRPE